MIDMNIRKSLTRALRWLAYVNACAAWLCAGMYYLPVLVGSSLITGSHTPDEHRIVHQTYQTDVTARTSALSVLIALTCVALIMSLVVWWLIKLPRKIEQVGDRVVRASSQQIVSITTHHQPLGRVKKEHYIARASIGVKLAASIVPVVFVVPLKFYRMPLETLHVPFEVALWLVVVPASTAFISFLLESLLGRKRQKTHRA